MRREVGPGWGSRPQAACARGKPQEAMIAAGATRIGTSSGLAIIGQSKPTAGATDGRPHRRGRQQHDRPHHLWPPPAPRGETLEAARFAVGRGGKGANQAVAAARLGARSR